MLCGHAEQMATGPVHTQTINGAVVREVVQEFATLKREKKRELVLKIKYLVHFDIISFYLFYSFRNSLFVFILIIHSNSFLISLSSL